ncbi:hypothetical protein F5I97DRAFT_2017 [Phlebopus sp. FC_14]|nr:hypothetical protein F5I97DRAFT_2017 [Phlebopus sp. FC_14]
MPSSMMYCIACFDKLVDDVLIQILQMSTVQAVLSLRQTCRRYYLLSKTRIVWHAKFRREVLARGLPPPGPFRPIATLSATDLEKRTLQALHLENQWSRLSAKVIASTQRRETVDQVVFIPGGVEIVTVQNDKLIYWHVTCSSGRYCLKRIAEWNGRVACKLVTDCENPGVIAVGPREQPNKFCTVFSLSQRRPFATLCDYALVPGILAGIWHHLLLLDITGEQDTTGGLALLDWHAQTTGRALLPCLRELYGHFVDFALFSDHILVAWENCMSVFDIPKVPAQGQVVMEHRRVFMFQEPISRPVAFTTCIARSLPAHDGSSRTRHSSLTIAARPQSKGGKLVMSMLVPLSDDDDEHGGDSVAPLFPYRLLRLSPYTPSILADAGGRVSQTCTSLKLGSSGRGICVFGEEVRICGPGVLFHPPCEMQIGPVFETGRALYQVDVGSAEKVDFDEGTGRFVVARTSGAFEVVQLC